MMCRATTISTLWLTGWALTGVVGCRPAAEPAELRVGLLIDGASIDQGPVVNAAELAVRELHDAGGLAVGRRRYPVELLVEKSFTTPVGATEAARLLVHEAGAVALIGPSVSRDAIRVGAVADNARIVMISPGATDPAVTAGRDFVFRVAFTNPFQGAVMARFAAADLGAATAAVLFDAADPYSRGIAEAFRDAFDAVGGRTTGFESYTTGERDFSSQLLRIRAARPDVLCLPGYNRVIEPQARHARELGIEAVLLGTDGWNPALLAELPAFDGAYVTEPWHLGVAETNSRARAFIDAYRSAFAENPTSLAALTYDAFGLLFEAGRRSGVDPEALRRGLAQVRGFPGVTGAITYAGGGGDPSKPAVILKIDGGRLRLHRQTSAPEPP